LAGLAISEKAGTDIIKSGVKEKKWFWGRGYVVVVMSERKERRKKKERGRRRRRRNK
jgi:hypothetical protein